MSTLGTVDQVRDTLAAFEAGNVSLSELEAILAVAIRSGLWTPSRAMDLLRDAVGRGIVPIEALHRLGIGEPDETILRPPSVSLKTDNPSESKEPTIDPHCVEASSARQADEAIGIGHVLGGRYRLDRKLGEGGMGVVYFASDQEVKGEHFAVKVLQHNIRTNPESLRLIREEVRKTRTLAHPNIVGAYSLNVDRDDVFVLMEYLEGKTVQELLDQEFGRGMRFDRAWPVIEGVGAGLAYAHDHSIIHGDLKPSNVFVTTSGRPKLLDFGIARAARGPARNLDSTARGSLTPAYASCEMLEFKVPDARDDIYAFACIVYEALSGKHPFGGRDAVTARDANEKPAPIDTLSPRQNAALAQGLAFDRGARTATVEALLTGLKQGANSRKRGSGLSASNWAVAFLIAGILGLSFFMVDKFWRSRQPSIDALAKSQAVVPNPIGDRTVAVLPFADMSEKHDQEYFGDGMSEEIIDLLSKVPKLKVIGRTSAFQFKGQSLDLRTIGQKLNATYVLEGSVRRSGDRLRVTATLINSNDGTHIMAETYDRNMSEIIKLQDEIAIGMVRALQITLGADEDLQDPPLSNPQAYTLYLRGRHSFDRFDPEGFEEAVGYFEQAVKLDPTLVSAWSWLATAYEGMGEWGYVPAFEKARSAGQHVLQLDPKNAGAHAILGTIHLVYDWDWASATQECDQARSLSPRQALILFTCGRLALFSGKLDDAFSMLNESLTLDPLYAPTLTVLCWLQDRRQHWAEAEADAQRAIDISPTYTSARLSLGQVLLEEGKTDSALAELSKSDSPLRGTAMVYWTLGRRAESNRTLSELKTKCAGKCAYAIAAVYAWRGQSDQALLWLDEAYSRKDPLLYQVNGDPVFSKISEEPRFKAFLRKINAPE